VVGDLTVEAVASYVRGRIDATDEPLPLIPPLQGRFAMGWAPRTWFVEAETRVAARQDRTGPFESATDGYAVFDLSAGIRITVRGRLNVITVRGENLGNAEYRNHLSRVKDIMPEAGRSISVAYRVVF
jgi:iron complex outermembrane receptor protein